MNTKPTLIISFERTTDAMAVDRFCSAKGLPGRLIPLPRAISAGCGMSWKAAPEDEPVLRQELTDAGLVWQDFHLIKI